MWVKRTEAEIKARKRRDRRTYLMVVVGLSVVCGAAVTLLRSGMEPARPGQIIVPRDQVAYRLPFGIFVGGLAAFLLTRCRPKPAAMICPKCEATKPDDGNSECACCGHFEKIDEMKYEA